jgi:hypothetical protein
MEGWIGDNTTGKFCDVTYQSLPRRILWSDLKGTQCTAVRALPVHAATGKTPQILFHTAITDLKSTGTSPTKRWFPTAAAAVIIFFSVPLFFLLGHLMML